MEKKNKIDVSLIPLIERKNLGKTFYEALERFYSDPENVKRFEEWKKEQEAREVVENQQTDDRKTRKVKN